MTKCTFLAVAWLPSVGWSPIYTSSTSRPSSGPKYPLFLATISQERDISTAQTHVSPLYKFFASFFLRRDAVAHLARAFDLSVFAGAERVPSIAYFSLNGTRSDGSGGRPRPLSALGSLCTRTLALYLRLEKARHNSCALLTGGNYVSRPEGPLIVGIAELQIPWQFSRNV